MSPFARLAILALAGLPAAGCSAIEADPHRFERWALQVAEIRLSAEEERPSERAGLRPAYAPLEIAVMEPEQLWAERDGPLPGLVEAAAPVAAAAVSEGAAVTLASATAGLRATRDEAVIVQLGAFSSEAAAQRAWTQITARAGEVARSLNPRFEPVSRDGRTLVRLRVNAASDEAAGRLCRAAGVSPSVCASTGRG